MTEKRCFPDGQRAFSVAAAAAFAALLKPHSFPQTKPALVVRQPRVPGNNLI